MKHTPKQRGMKSIKRSSARLRMQSAMLVVVFVCASFSESVSAAGSWSPTLLVNTEAFQVIEDANITADIKLRFGGTISEELFWNRAASRFQFTDDLFVEGGLSTSGTFVVGGLTQFKDSIEVRGVASGRTLHAQDTLSSSGNIIAVGNIRTTHGTLKGQGLVFASGTTIIEQAGFSEFANLMRSGLGTNGVMRMTNAGNLVNIGSIQAGQTHVRRGGSFAAKADYAVASFPHGIATGDLNGDGKADIAVTNYGSASVSVFLNNGDGTFAARVDYATANGPRGVSIGELNGDGSNDLAIVGYEDDAVSILLNAGSGTFAAKTDYTTQDSPFAVSIGDVNGDGKADIAAANVASDSVSVLLNNGNGTFAAKTDYTTGDQPESVMIGELNGDGKADMVATNQGDDSVSVFLNSGKGTFAAKVDYTTGTAPHYVVISDLNGDSKGDLAVANSDSTSVSVFINDGDGTFADKVDYTTGSTPSSIAIGDLNGDGKADIAAPNYGSATVSVFINNGNGTFAAKVDYTTGTNPIGSSVGDLNGDGMADLAVANTTSETVSVFFNKARTVLFAGVGTGGAVGIGTATPGSALAVSGSVVVNPQGTLTNKKADVGLALEVIGTASGRMLHAQDLLTSSGNLIVGGSARIKTNLTANGTVSGAKLTFMAGGDSYIMGNVGVGTVSPTTKLEVVGTISGSNVTISNLRNCDTIDTDGAGVLSCGDDETGAGGGLSFGDIVGSFVNQGGDTMTGSLILNGANVGLTASGQLRAGGAVLASGALVIGGAGKIKGDFTLNSDSGAADAILTFGSDSTNETLKFLNNEDRFEFSDDLHATGNLSASGTFALTGNARLAGKVFSELGYDSLNDGLVGYWPLAESGSTTVNDRSKSGKQGTVSSAIWATGKVGSALNFDGNGDIVTTTLTSPDTFTWTTWFKMDALPVADIGSLITEQSATYMLMSIGTTGDSSFWSSDGLAGATLGVEDLTAGTWYHLAFVREGDSRTNGYKAYLNGMYKGQADTGTWSPTSTVSIGGRSGTAGQTFDGTIDEARIYNRALSADDIRLLYQRDQATTTTFTVQSDSFFRGTIENGLTGWWAMDQMFSADDVEDLSINNNSGALVGGPTLSVGRFGKAMSFDGSDDYVTAGSIANIRTVSLWFRHDAPFKNFSRLFTWGSNQFTAYTDASGNVTLYYNGGSIGTYGGLSADTWYHFVGTMNGSTAKAYINGVEKISGSATAADSSATFLIGQAGSDQYWDGKIDDVRIYDYAFTPRAIAELYRNNPLGDGGTLITSFRIESGASLNVAGTASGRMLHAQDLLTTSGSLIAYGDSKIKGDLAINSDNGAASAILTFGNDTLAETLKFLRAEHRFEFSDDLNVANNITGSGNFIISGSARIKTNLTTNGKTSGAYLTFMQGANSYIMGNTGIGTATPTTKLEVVGIISGAQIFAQNGLSSSGGMVVSGTGTLEGNTVPGNAATLTLVNATDDVGSHSAIVCLTASNCKMAYLDASNTNLIFVDCDDVACVTKTTTTVDSGNLTGGHISMACPTAGDCKISYYDGTNGYLKMADCNDETCSAPTLTDVDTGVSAGQYSDIACPSATDCKIAYLDATNSYLKMADCDDAACSTGTLTDVDTGVSAGQHTSIYCVSATDCKIAYHDATNGYLKMADCDDATCSTKTLTDVDTTATTGYNTGINCPATDNCKISYYDPSGQDLEFADCDDATCSTKTLTTLDGTDAVGEYTSIDCPTSANCKIAYYDSTNTALRFIDCDGETCANNTRVIVDSTGSSGQYTDIACVASNDCKIAHYDAGNGDARFVDCTSETCRGDYSLGTSQKFYTNVYADTYYAHNTTVQSFDVAENYPVRDTSIKAGDVVALTGCGNIVGKTMKAYDPMSLGVISTDPGLLLAHWEKDPNNPQRPVALTGRVPVRVTAANGPISVGDFITSSDIPGVAMKATKPGMVLGRALESYIKMEVGLIQFFIQPLYFGGTLPGGR